jgi:hypothetical protein
MPSRRGLEQALTWLKSKMAEGDTLDAINAELCYNVMMDIQNKRKVIGALYHQSYTAEKRAKEKLEEMELLQLEESLRQVFCPNEGSGDSL